MSDSRVTVVGSPQTLTTVLRPSALVSTVVGSNPGPITKVAVLQAGSTQISAGVQKTVQVSQNQSPAETWESISQNIKSFPKTFVYTNNLLTSVAFSLGGGKQITKTLAYISGILQAVTLSGDIPAGVVARTKTLVYESGELSSLIYS